ncbi:MAG: DNA mismatch repair endonuclease MutL [Marinisporobacter sp.]|jgi:DNA mismatch repair protein MutL|nr:DNA mismatch repair endonuclease MutL [Marinisporobacter sp.]
MSKKIYKLEKFIANKIAAGEVVDRPSSVVKELVENAIDAKASKIIIEIKDGGKSYIRITDNGVGIHEEDMEIAFERHATSKIKNVEDLDSILSLGFRGEALASIASVSQVELISKTREEPSGTYLELHGGQIIEHKDIGCPNGTTFVIKNLFYNVPARLQFMKSNATETSYISDLISKYALAYPDISFRFINKGTIVFTTSGSSSIVNNIASIYGKEMAKNMLYLANKKSDTFSIQSYISKPTTTRGNKQLQVFFVNGRYVKNKMISEAIEEAYRTLITINRFPICFIYLTVPPDQLDVNIHPTKTEVRFNKGLNIKEFVKDTLKERLLRENLIPSVGFERPKKKEDGHQERIIDLPRFKKMGERNEIKPLKKEDKMIAPIDVVKVENKKNVKDLVFEDKSTYHVNNKNEKNHEEVYLKKEESSKKQKKDKNIKKNIYSDIQTENQEINRKVITNPVVNHQKIDDEIITNQEIHKEKIDDKKINNIKESKPISSKVLEKKKNNENADKILGIRILGQIFNTYLIGQDGQSMYLIDQHAAHERIMYDKLMENYQKQSPVSQKLLAPILVELSFSEFKIVKKNMDMFTQLGFEIEEFGINALILRAVPVLFGKPEAKKFFIEIVDHLQKDIQSSYDMKIEKIISMSCKQAIKANDQLDPLEIDQLMKQLSELENPFTCPHGRPVIVAMSKYEIEKKFKRV